MAKLNFTAVLFLLLLVTPLHAQRTMKGQPFLQAAAHWGGAPGMSVSGGQYLERSLWEAGVKAQGFRAPLSTGDILECLDITAGGDMAVEAGIDTLPCTVSVCRGRAVRWV